MISDIRCGRNCIETGFYPSFWCFPTDHHTHLTQLHEVWNSPDQAAHYHFLGPKVRSVISVPTLGYVGLTVAHFNFYNSKLLRDVPLCRWKYLESELKILVPI